jgi:hypothetical protein
MTMCMHMYRYNFRSSMADLVDASRRRSRRAAAGIVRRLGRVICVSVTALSGRATPSLDALEEDIRRGCLKWPKKPRRIVAGLEYFS